MQLFEQPSTDPLLGQPVGDGWTISRRITRNSSGGCFSIGYQAEHPAKPHAFVKVLNLSHAITQPDMTSAVRQMSTAFEYERDLLEHCRGIRLSRVVKAIDAGELNVPQLPIPRVPYLLFEAADTDIRRLLDDIDAQLDLATVLRYLHHISVGLGQLHANRIAHQDIKPSNVLVFSDSGAKLADLGCASQQNNPAPRDDLRVPGDPLYSPIEFIYGFLSPDFEIRRLAADMFQLASITHFLFAKVHLNTAIIQQLAEPHLPGNWRSSFVEILPHLQFAFTGVLRDLSDALPKNIQIGLVECVRHLGNPDPRDRGHPHELRAGGSQYSMKRFVSSFNQLAALAEADLRRMIT